jgi:hypothetical protein
VAASSDLEIEHRRVATAGLTADANWAATRTFPTDGPDLASGQARAIQPEASRVVIFWEAYAGVADSSAPVTDTTGEVTFQFVTKYLVRDQVVVSKGQTATLSAQERSIEIEVPKYGKSFVRITAVSNLDGANAAIWIFADDRMTP